MSVEYLKITSKNKEVLLNNPELFTQMYFFSISKISRESMTIEQFYNFVNKKLVTHNAMIYLAKEGNKIISGLEGRIRVIEDNSKFKEFYISSIFVNPNVKNNNNDLELKILLRTIADLRVNYKHIINAKTTGLNSTIYSIFKKATGEQKIELFTKYGNKKAECLRKVGNKNKIVTYKGINLETISPDIYITRKKVSRVKPISPKPK